MQKFIDFMVKIQSGWDFFLRHLIYFDVFATLYFLIILIIGVLFKSKKFKPTDKKYKYAILIPARNEEKTIGNLIDSIKKQDYLKDDKSLITIFVIADDCQDKTAEIARNMGAIVYERPNPPRNKRRKGFALKFLVENIRKDYGIEKFDGYLVMDADNLLGKEYMRKMNDAFDNKEYDMFSSYSNIKNFGTNVISSYLGANYYNVALTDRAESFLGIGTKPDGRGVLMRNNVLMKKGFKWCGLSENTEFSYDMYSHGKRITWVSQAEYFDEEPLSLRIHLRQCMRWGKGNTVAYLKYFVFLFIGVFAPYDFKKTFTSPKKEETPKIPAYKRIPKRILVEFQKRFTCLSKLITSMPLYVINTAFFVIWFVLEALRHAIDHSYSLSHIWTYLIALICFVFIAHCASFALTIIREHKRMRIHPLKLALYFMVWPFIKYITDIVSCLAVFWPVKWKKIPHVVDKKIEDIYDTPTLLD